MNTTVLADGKKIFLNPFMSQLIGNVINGIAVSLKQSGGQVVEFRLTDEDLHLIVDSGEVALTAGSARKIVGNILRGIIINLHGAENAKKFRFILER